MEWEVRNSLNPEGPGPNYFSGQSVWVDKKGFLHLHLHQDPASGRWLCPEITSVSRFSYGTYRFVVEGPIGKFDKDLVLGLFNYSGHDGFDELDIEFSRWGNPAWPNLNYTVWPAEKGFHDTSYTHEYTQHRNRTVQQFIWRKDTVIFSSFEGNRAIPDHLIATSRFIQPPVSISHRPMPVHINLWLFDGKPPLDGKAVDVIIRSFNFQP